MSYKRDMSDREVARAAMKLIRENASLIDGASYLNRVWFLIISVDCDNESKPLKDRL